MPVNPEDRNSTAEVERAIEETNRKLASCQVHCSLTVLHAMTEEQKRAIVNLALRFNSTSVRLSYGTFGLPEGYIAGTLMPASFDFGVSTEGEVSS
jgi:hypothetical protein